MTTPSIHSLNVDAIDWSVTAGPWRVDDLEHFWKMVKTIVLYPFMTVDTYILCESKDALSNSNPTFSCQQVRIFLDQVFIYRAVSNCVSKDWQLYRMQPDQLRRYFVCAQGLSQRTFGIAPASCWCFYRNHVAVCQPLSFAASWCQHKRAAWMQNSMSMSPELAFDFTPSKGKAQDGSRCRSRLIFHMCGSHWINYSSCTHLAYYKASGSGGSGVLSGRRKAVSILNYSSNDDWFLHSLSRKLTFLFWIFSK